MRAVIAVTDTDWAAHLRARPDLSEANFWYPKPTGTFRALSTGEYFLFKSKAEAGNRLIGGGYLSGYALLTVKEAWELFGEGNGVSSHAALLAKIQRYRKDSKPDPTIGCVLLRDIFFTDSPPPAPTDFKGNIVRFKKYDLGSPTGAPIRDVLGGMFEHLDDRDSTVPGPVFGDPRLVISRLGQQAFKGLVLAAYQRRCAVTGVRIQPVLEAAHIRPVAHEGEHAVSNGLLLRSDVHTLFDRGYLGLDLRHRLQVSPRLRIDFGNGREFYAREGVVIDLPDRRALRPNEESISWHMDTVFKHQ